MRQALLDPDKINTQKVSERPMRTALLDPDPVYEDRSKIEQPSVDRHSIQMNDGFFSTMLKSHISIRVEDPDYNLGEKYEKAYEKLPESIREFLPIPKPSTVKIPEVSGALEGGLETGREFLDTTPVLKYLIGDNREQLLKMSPEQQRMAIVMDTVEGMAFGALGRLGEVKRGAQNLWTAATKGKKALRPIEDNIARVERMGLWEGFTFERGVEKKLSGMRFSDEERELVKDVILGGNPKQLSNYQKRMQWEGRETSKLFTQTVLPTPEPYGGAKLSGRFASNFSVPKLQAEHYHGLMKSNLDILRKEYHWAVPPADKVTREAVAKGVLLKYFPEEELTGKTFGEIGEPAMAQVLVDLFKDPKMVKKTMRAGGDRLYLNGFHRTENVFGAGELLYGTKTNVFDRLVGAQNSTNMLRFDYTSVFAGMLEQRKFGQSVYDKAGKVVGFKASKALDKGMVKSVNDYLTTRDNLHSLIRATEKNPIRIKQLEKQLIQAQKDFGIKQNSDAQMLVSAYDDFHKFLYGEYLKQKPVALLAREGLNQRGLDELTEYMTQNHHLIDQKFASGSTATNGELVSFINSTLDDYRSFLRPSQNGTHRWFSDTGKALERKLDKLRGQIDYATVGGELPDYLEGYASRIYQKGAALSQKWGSALQTRKTFGSETRKLVTSYFAKARTEDLGDPLRMLDFFSRVEARASSQAKDLYLYPEIDQTVDYARKYLPDGWRWATDNVVSRMLNRPGLMDHVTAGIIDRLPFTRDWDARRVMDVARTFQTMQYGGFLGLKGYSPARNLLQVVMTGAADGKLSRDAGGLAVAYAKSFNPQMRKYMREEAKVITDYLPETTGKSLFGGQKPGATFNKVYDSTLVLFKASDTQNRMVMGSWAFDKWDKAVAKIGGRINQDNLSKFYKALDASSMWEWKRAEISGLLRKGEFKEAKHVYMRNFVADNQYLYGKLDQPIAYNLMGQGIGKNLTAFQSWWMNYGALMEKWVRTGQGPGGKAEAALNFMLAQTATYIAAEKLWGPTTARSQAFFGPMPLQGIPTPPVIDLAGKWGKIGVQALSDATSRGVGYEKTEAAVLDALKETWYYTPGGQATWTMGREFNLQGAEGVGSAITGSYKRDRDRRLPLLPPY